MEKEHLNVGLIYGGLSSEHEVSIASARNVFAALAPEKYRITPIYIDTHGGWHVGDDVTTALQHSDTAPNPAGNGALLAPMDDGAEVRVGRWNRDEGVARLESLALDVAFPMLHGQNGEDGRVQGLLRSLGLPFVGADVLGSAVCMDKEVTKRLLRDAGFSIVPFRAVRRGESLSFAEAAEALGPTLFVKPANSGSSIGTSKVGSAEAYDRAVTEAFRYDNKILVETAVTGREIECAVIGNDEPRTAVPGEIISSATFYTYDAKYNDPDAAHMEVPADLPEDIAEEVRTVAAGAYRALGCEGMARVDFFLMPDHELFINEINTIPGFTERSMFPVMWEHTGLPLSDLVDTLIQLALDRHERDARLKTKR